MTSFPKCNRVYFLFFLFTLILPSCIKDELSDCPSRVRLYFNYIPANYSAIEGINPANINCMNLYVFDDDGRFVTEVIDNNPEMSHKYYMEVTGLETGLYRFISWGGLDNENYIISENLIVGQTSYEDIVLKLNKIENNTVTANLPYLFYAANKKGEVWIQENNLYQDTLQLTQNTYKINLSIQGVKEINDTHKVVVSDDNGAYTFSNAFAKSPQFQYVSDCKKISKEELSSSLVVLKLTETRSPIIEIINITDNQTLFKRNLVQLILAIRQVGGWVDFDYMYEFNIELIVNPDPVIGFDIYINGWKLTRINEEL